MPVNIASLWDYKQGKEGGCSKNWSRPTNFVSLRERGYRLKGACKLVSLSPTCLQTLKRKFFPAGKFQLYPKFAGEEFLYRLSPQNPVLWINFRGTGKNPGIRLELGKTDGFPEKGKLSRIFPLVRRFDRCW